MAYYSITAKKAIEQKYKIFYHNLNWITELFIRNWFLYKKFRQIKGFRTETKQNISLNIFFPPIFRFFFILLVVQSKYFKLLWCLFCFIEYWFSQKSRIKKFPSSMKTRKEKQKGLKSEQRFFSFFKKSNFYNKNEQTARADSPDN